jgi:transposase InsO family protein
VSELRTAFVHAVRTAHRPVSAAAREYGISRKTAGKWLARFDAHDALLDRSRRPHHSPARTAPGLERAVLQVRDAFHCWGPRKIHAHLRRHGHPAPGTRATADVLARHGRVARPAPDPGPPADVQRFERPRPDDLWPLDFKGWIEIGRARVSPLTVLDDHSRFLPALRPCTDLTMRTAWGVLWDALGEFGRPEAVLCDTASGTPGTPDSRGASGLESRLLRLGIRPTHGRPYHPQTRGKVERLHGTLVREVYPHLDRTDRAAFTAGLDHWRRAVDNPARPHEGIGDPPPAARWRPSPRPRPAALPVVEYPPGSVLRKVGSNGLFEYRRARVLAGRGLAGEPVRVEEADDHLLVFYTTEEVRRIPIDRLNTTGIM